jgi:nuclear RNA export factor
MQIRASIRPSTTTSSESTTTSQQKTGSLETLATILRNRYMPESKFLNLNGLESDPAMAAHPALTGFGNDFHETQKIGPVLCKLIGQLFPDVNTISVESNRLTSLKPFSTLPQWAPLVQNLSFRDNLITSYRDIEGLKGTEVPNLRELIFAGNPVREKEVRRPGGELQYRK